MTPASVSSLREAIHATATASGLPLKQLAAELDWSPSELSMRITLGGESGRAFPADDEHLVKLMQVTGSRLVLEYLADKFNFELKPKEARLGEHIDELKRGVAKVQRQLDLVLELSTPPPAKRR